MSYVDRNLLTGEVVTFRTHLHWREYVPAVLFTLFVVVPAIVLLVANHFGLYALAPAAVGAGGLLAAHLKRSSSEFAVTNKRVMIKLGVMSTRSLELLLTKVEGIAVQQGLGGKVFGYGDIVVTGSGGTRESFSGIQRPMEFRRALQEAAEAYGRGAGGAQG